MLRVTDDEGELWIEPSHILTMRPFGKSVEIRMREGIRFYAKNTSCDKLARQIAGSDF